MDDQLFDKFMKEIVAEEAKKAARAEDERQDTPTRVYAKRYRELPQNRIFFRPVKESK